MKTYRIELQDGAHPELHEYQAAEVLAREAPVLFLCPSRKRGEHTPDIEWKNLRWEIKSPKSHKNLEHNILKAALKQSPNIIIDLRRLSCREDTIKKIIMTYSVNRKAVKNMIVITKSSEIYVIK